MQSPNLIRLSQRLTYLKSTLTVVPKSSLISTSAQVEVDRVSFCAIMAGAACEKYIEEMSLQLADSSDRKFLDSNTLGRVGKYLCVFPFVEFRDNKDIKKMAAVYGATGFDIRVSSKMFVSSQRDIKELLNIGYLKIKKQIKDNHGFGLKYQLRLLSAIGADLTSFDPTFSSRIQQLMQFRGEAAHNTVVAATTVPTATDMATWIDDLNVGFKKLDMQLSKLEKKVQ